MFVVYNKRRQKLHGESWKSPPFYSAEQATKVFSGAEMKPEIIYRAQNLSFLGHCRAGRRENFF